MTTRATSLDHVVVNTLFEMDPAADCFEALGFTLTPRGYHSLGSINHLIMFPDHYLELVGLPRDTETLRREVLESPLGIDGLVFKSDDAVLTHQELTAQGFEVGAPQEFSRPVEIDRVKQLARFKTTRLVAGQVPAGRVYFCQHLTPEWVFRAEWASHPNGATGLVEMVVVSAAPRDEAQRYARLANLSGDRVEAAGATCKISVAGFEVSFLDATAYRTRFGLLVVPAPRPEMFGALVIRVADLAVLRGRLDDLARRGCTYPNWHAPDGSSCTVLLREFNTLIEFIGGSDNAVA